METIEPAGERRGSLGPPFTLQVLGGREVRRRVEALQHDDLIRGAFVCVVHQYLGRRTIRLRLLVEPEYDDPAVVAARLQRRGGYRGGLG